MLWIGRTGNVKVIDKQPDGKLSGDYEIVKESE